MDSSRYDALLLQHYEGSWGRMSSRERWETGRVAELPAEFSVLVFAPHGSRRTWAYATCGMPSPDGRPRIELHLFAPTRDEAHVELLFAVAHFHSTGSPLGLHHTVNFGRPWCEGSRCDRGFISLPYVDGPELEDWKFDGQPVRCLWLIPVTEGEVAFKRAHGAEGLEQRFDKPGFDYADPKRESMAGPDEPGPSNRGIFVGRARERDVVGFVKAGEHQRSHRAAVVRETTPKDLRIIDVLLRIVVDQLCFLELSDDETINEDAAVEQFESIVSELASLGRGDRDRLVGLLAAVAAQARTKQASSARVEFLSSLPDALGLLKKEE